MNYFQSTYRRSYPRYARRQGNVLVMTAFMMVALIAFVALAVDVGYLYTMRNELQRTADAAAIAATWELVDQEAIEGTVDPACLECNARTTACTYAALNKVGNASPLLASDDVEVGYMANPSNPSEVLGAPPSGKMPNAVRVRIQRTSTQNGEIPLFFARMLGFDKQSATAEATAALLHSFVGFEMPADGSNLMILPFALDLQTWNDLQNGIGSDSYTYNTSTKNVNAGSDGILECNLYPQGTGVPGNRGTIDIGGNANSTDDIARQVLNGINQSDFDALAAQGKSLNLSSGPITLIGDTGISAGVRGELASIKGQPRILPIFSTVAGPGNNAVYTISKFVGVRIMDVKLTGSMTNKKLMIQPCNIVIKGGIYSEAGSSTDFVYSPVWLVR